MFLTFFPAAECPARKRPPIRNPHRTARRADPKRIVEAWSSHVVESIFALNNFNPQSRKDSKHHDQSVTPQGRLGRRANSRKLPCRISVAAQQIPSYDYRCWNSGDLPEQNIGRREQPPSGKTCNPETRASNKALLFSCRSHKRHHAGFPHDLPELPLHAL